MRNVNDFVILIPDPEWHDFANLIFWKYSINIIWAYFFRIISCHSNNRINYDFEG